MRYHLTVRRVDTNENYEAELAEWERNQNRPMPMYNYGPGTGNPMAHPTPDKTCIALEVILTDIEFSHLKRHVMEIFQ